MPEVRLDGAPGLVAAIRDAAAYDRVTPLSPYCGATRSACASSRTRLTHGTSIRAPPRRNQGVAAALRLVAAGAEDNSRPCCPCPATRTPTTSRAHGRRGEVAGEGVADAWSTRGQEMSVPAVRDADDELRIVVTLREAVCPTIAGAVQPGMKGDPSLAVSAGSAWKALHAWESSRRSGSRSPGARWDSL